MVVWPPLNLSPNTNQCADADPGNSPGTTLATAAGTAPLRNMPKERAKLSPQNKAAIREE